MDHSQVSVSTRVAVLLAALNFLPFQAAAQSECGLLPTTQTLPRSRFTSMPAPELHSEDGSEMWIGRYPDESIDRISSIAFAADGSFVVSAGVRDRTVYVWDVRVMNLTPPSVLVGHTAPVRAVAIAPDGRRIASASADKTIRVWSVKTEQAEMALCGHEGAVLTVAFSPGGELVASGGVDKTLRLWNTATAEARAILRGFDAPVRSVAFSPDGKQIAAGAADGVIRLWSVADAAATRVLSNESKLPITALGFSPDGKRLAAAEKGRVAIWDVATGQQVIILKGPSDDEAVSFAGFSPTGERVFAGFASGVVAFDVATGSIAGTLSAEDLVNGLLGAGRFDSAAISRDGARVAAGLSDLTVRVWTTDNIKRVHEAPLGSGETACAGDACGTDAAPTLKPTWENNCLVFTNVTGRAIVVEVGRYGANESFLLKPGEKRNVPGCPIWTGLGSYRASYR